MKRGVEERDTDDLMLIHHTSAAQKKLHGGFATIHALESGHAGPELSKKQPSEYTT